MGCFGKKKGEMEGNESNKVFRRRLLRIFMLYCNVSSSVGRQRKLFFMIWDPCCGSEQYFIFDEKLYALLSSFLHPIYMLNSFFLFSLLFCFFVSSYFSVERFPFFFSLHSLGIGGNGCGIYCGIQSNCRALERN